MKETKQEKAEHAAVEKEEAAAEKAYQSELGKKYNVYDVPEVPVEQNLHGGHHSGAHTGAEVPIGSNTPGECAPSVRGTSQEPEPKEAPPEAKAVYKDQR
jgi:alkaline phosphatase